MSEILNCGGLGFRLVKVADNVSALHVHVNHLTTLTVSTGGHVFCLWVCQMIYRKGTPDNCPTH